MSLLLLLDVHLVPHSFLEQAGLVLLLARVLLAQSMPVEMVLLLQAHDFVRLLEQVQVHLILRNLVGIHESQVFLPKQSAVLRVLLTLHLQNLNEVVQKHLGKEQDAQCGHQANGECTWHCGLFR